MAILSDEFYYQPLRIDTINTRVFADLVAKEGDANGRGLLVTLTENGLMKDTTGITLILKWEHMSVDNQGLDNFEAVDPSKGLYKITYPTEMLNRGRVCAFIQIIDSGKLVGTSTIEITVDRGVGNDAAIESSDSFTALAQALIDVNSNKSALSARITSVEQELAATVNDIDTSLTPRITSVEQELAAVKSADTAQASRILSVEQQLTETANDIDTSLTPRITSVEQDLVAVKSTDTSHASRITSVEQQLTLISGAPVTFAPTLLNSWVNFGEGFAPVKYRKGPDNMVHIGGLIKNGVTSEGTVIFTLPSGFRPEFKEIFTIAQDNTIGRIDVNDNGNVIVVRAGAVFTSLSGISFLAKN